MGDFQRIGSTSNSRVDSDSETQVRAFFATQGVMPEEYVLLCTIAELEHRDR